MTGSASPSDPFAASYEQISETTKHARGVWFTLLGAMALVATTLMGMEDADFFKPGGQVAIPLVSLEVSFRSFFAFAPVAIALLYIYLHAILRRNWRLVAMLPSEPATMFPEDKLYPSLLTDLALQLRGDARRSSLSCLFAVGTALLIWLAPITVIGLCLRRIWFTNDLALFAVIVVTLWLLVIFFAISVNAVRLAYADAHFLHGRPIPALALRCFQEPTFRFSFFGSFFTSALVGPLLVYFGLEHAVNRTIGLAQEHNARILPANMAEAEFAVRPDGWRAYNDARLSFMAEYAGIPRSRIEAQLASDPEWLSKATRIFEERRAALFPPSNRSSFTGDDLTGANLREIFAPYVTFIRAGLADADLQLAVLEGANFRGADLLSADLDGARMENTLLRGARLAGASIEGASLLDADLSPGRAKSDSREPFATDLRGTDLSHTQLAGADLRCAAMQGTYMPGADLARAKNLTQRQLNGTLGSAKTRLPDGMKVPACFVDYEPTIGALSVQWDRDRTTEAEFREHFACPPGEPVFWYSNGGSSTLAWGVLPQDEEPVPEECPPLRTEALH